MSKTLIAVFIQLAVIVLPLFGVKVGSAELTGAITTITTIVTGLFIWYRRYKEGDIKLFGAKKY